MREQLTRDNRGMYRKDLGFKTDDLGTVKQHRFYLGRDRSQALVRALQLESVWEAVGKVWQRDRQTARPLWDATTLSIASAVARGESRAVVNHTLPDGALPDGAPPVRPDIVMAWLVQLRHDFPMVTIDLEDKTVQQQGQERLAQHCEKSEHLIQWIKQVDNSQTLHMALDAYIDHVRSTNKAADNPEHVSAFGQNQIGQLAILKAHHEDIPLAAFDLHKIEKMIDYWRMRPLTKRNKRAAPNSCREVIKRIRNFMRWLHKTPQFVWRKPEDLEFLPVRFPITHTELSAKLTPDQVATYTIPELVTLYQNATPQYRLFMLLALNCDFGQAEIASLLTGEIHLDQTHPKYHVQGAFIKRVRFKSRVYGEWQLWAETVAGIRWQLSQRPTSGRKELILTAKGKPYNAATVNGKRTARIAVLWDKLTEQIQRDQPFRKLSFNKLRKTGADIMRDIAGGEVAGVYQSHGSPVPSDTLSDAYTNRPFDKVFAGLASMRERLAPMFNSVAEPFPAGAQQRKSYLPFRKIQRIKDMTRQGFTQKKIAADLDIDRATVRKYARA
jgi:hypothetical protein